MKRYLRAHPLMPDTKARAVVAQPALRPPEKLCGSGQVEGLGALIQAEPVPACLAEFFNGLRDAQPADDHLFGRQRAMTRAADKAEVPVFQTTSAVTGLSQTKGCRLVFQYSLSNASIIPDSAMKDQEPNRMFTGCNWFDCHAGGGWPERPVLHYSDRPPFSNCCMKTRTWLRILAPSSCRMDHRGACWAWLRYASFSRILFLLVEIAI